jgi:hypothetical protein
MFRDVRYIDLSHFLQKEASIEREKDEICKKEVKMDQQKQPRGVTSTFGLYYIGVKARVTR